MDFKSIIILINLLLFRGKQLQLSGLAEIKIEIKMQVSLLGLSV
tara:strand:- start:688 stop:819 length:132 start_codon:yes stop_codon:yes gene_type:complete